MAKRTQKSLTAKPKNTNKSSTSFLRSRTLLVALAVIVAVILGWVIWQQVLTLQEKHRFQQADKDVQQLAADIVQSLGKPEQKLHVTSCNHIHEELFVGTLYCDVDEYLSYNVKTAKEAARVRSIASQVINGHQSTWNFVRSTRVGIPEGSSSFTNFSKLPSYQEASDIYKSAGAHLVCSSTYLYHSSDYLLTGLPATLNLNRAQAVLIDLNCSQGARAAYYPISQN